MPIEKSFLTDKGIYKLVKRGYEIRLYFPKPKDSILSKINNNTFFCYYEATADEEEFNTAFCVWGSHQILRWVVDNPIKLYSFIASDKIDIDPEILEMFINEV